jgi:hypothetical protein
VLRGHGNAIDFRPRTDPLGCSVITPVLVITVVRARERATEKCRDHGKFLITLVEPCDHTLDVRDQEDDMITEFRRLAALS